MNNILGKNIVIINNVMICCCYNYSTVTPHILVIWEILLYIIKCFYVIVDNDPIRIRFNFFCIIICPNTYVHARKIPVHPIPPSVTKRPVARVTSL